MDPLVTVIVPVYNSRDYIKRCTESILKQDYQNLDILMIDDGSTDGTGELLDQYALQDERVRVIHQKNAGVSASRNRALDLARGEYIQFADSDDWLTPDATRLLVRAAREGECDLVIADFYRVTGSRLSQKDDIDTDRVLDRMEFAGYMIENPADFYYGVLWNKLYRRSLIEEHHIRMDTELNWCEDFLFNLEYIRFAQRFCAVQAPVYYYVRRKGSLVSQGSSSISNTIRMKINVFEYYSTFYRDVYEGSYEDIRPKVNRFLFSAAKDGFVPPAPVPGSIRLGQERLTVGGIAARDSGGLLAENYRYRMLLEYHLGTAAALKKATVDEMLLLLLFRDSASFENQKEISDLTCLSPQKTARALGKLRRREVVALQTDEKEGIRIELLDKAGEYMAELETALRDFEQDCISRLTEEDAQTYRSMKQQVSQTIRDRLAKL